MRKNHKKRGACSIRDSAAGYGEVKFCRQRKSEKLFKSGPEERRSGLRALRAKDTPRTEKNRLRQPPRGASLATNSARLGR
jgi:hypothetical protein